jgi:hypothetical protein
MNFIYYVDGEKFTTDDWDEIPYDKISSPNEETPAIEYLTDGYSKEWCKKGRIWHRLTGPALIDFDGTEYFWLNGKEYKNFQAWLKAHPNKTNIFQVEMLLKYG